LIKAKLGIVGILLGLFAVNSAIGQPHQSLSLRQANDAARQAQLQEQAQKISAENFDLRSRSINEQVSDLDTKYWRELLWTTAVVEPQQTYVAEALAQILDLANKSNLSANQSEIVTVALRVSVQLYKGKSDLYGGLAQNFVNIIESSSNPTWVAMSLSGLASLDHTEVKRLTALARQRFNTSGLTLQTTLRTLEANNQYSAPPLKDLLNGKVAAGQPHLYVVCTSDRSLLCQTILKDKQGKFLRQVDGKLWSMPLFLQSLHRIPWNFTNGQTPQGIYRLEGLEPETNAPPNDKEFLAYGQFPLVKLFMPFEPKVKEFLPGKRGSFKGSLGAYQALLPPSWRNHFPMQQSYWAGMLGRSFIRIHGTGFASNYFRAQNPANNDWNPALGCLSALELYDRYGNLQQADIPKLTSALQQAGQGKVTGFAVVVDLPPGQDPLLEIEQAIASL
jgi:hypothetical protein